MKLLNSAAVRVVVLVAILITTFTCGFASATTFTPHSNSTTCFQAEKQALLKLKHGLIDESLLLASWVGDDCCTWHGIRCSRRTGHVVQLDLHIPYIYNDEDSYENYKYHFLRGKLDNSLQNLKYLTHLDLSWNDFSEIPIPDFLGSLINLRYLNLSSTSFIGRIPYTLGNLSCLQYLDLSYNYGLESVDSLLWVSKLSSLKHLDLSYLNLMQAINWAPSINMLPSLSVLNLEYCDLPSSIPQRANTNFTNLVSIDLSYNKGPDISALLHWLSNATNLMELDLRDNSYGSVPESIGMFKSLTFLDLSSNKLEGPITTEIFNLKNLVNLGLSSNKLEGPIPNEISNLKNLVNLDLSYNKLEGPIPNEISNLAQLTLLRLRGNRLTGMLPPSLFQKLKFLEILDLGYNSLSGTIPASIGQLSKLKALYLDNNKLSGLVSENHLHNLTSIDYLYISSNSEVVLNVSSTWNPPFQLKGLSLSSCKLGPTFPQWLRNQRNVEFLHLSGAGLAGTIPDWLQWVFSPFGYTELVLSNNQLTGKWLSIPSRLQVLDVSNNLLSELKFANGSKNISLARLDASKNLFLGAFLTWLCNTEIIEYIDLSDNQLSGTIPPCMRSLGYLQLLHLTDNSLSGIVPRFLGSLPFLRSLHLGNNKFEGELPDSFRNLSKLVTLDVAKNVITGIIPPWIGETFSYLKVLNLKNNKFHGPIPGQLCQLRQLQLLNLAQNNIKGSIPPCFGNLIAMRDDSNYGKFSLLSDSNHTTMSYVEKILENLERVEREYPASYFVSIDLSDNNITGVIPKELMNLVQLVKFNVSGNHITGRIPDQIGNLTKLISLDVSRNQLSGPIPQSLSNLFSLEQLNLSFNDLSGKIPTGRQLQTLTDPSIYIGNLQLCGAPSLSKCPGEQESSSKDTDEDGHEEDEDESHVWFYSGMGPGSLVGFLGFCAALHFNKTWRYAYFGFIENVYDKLVLAIALKAAWLSKKFVKQ